MANAEQKRISLRLTFIFSLFVVFFLVLLLVRQWRAHQELKGSIQYLESGHLILWQNISRDLLSVGAFRGSCHLPNVQVQARGTQLQLFGADPRSVTVLSESSAKGRPEVVLADRGLPLHAGQAFSICYENTIEAVVIETVSAGLTSDAGTQLVVRNLITGKRKLENSFPDGAMFFKPINIKYEWRNGIVLRKEDNRVQNLLNDVRSFSIAEPSTLPPSFKVSYKLHDSYYGSRREFQFDWVPWYHNLQLSNQEALALYTQKPY